MFKAPLLNRSIPIAEKDLQMSYTFHRWLETLIRAIRLTFEQVQASVDAIALAQAAADSANAAAALATAAADDATTAADNAQTTADTIIADNNLVNSSCPDAAITATDVGSNVTVSITAHTRTYGDNTSVSVNSGSVTGLSYSTTYNIYYDQASRLGGSVTYLATTDPAVASQTGDRHVIGSVTTPAALGAPVDGGVVYPPGLGNIYLL